MTLAAYAESVSCAPGDDLRFHVVPDAVGVAGGVTVTVFDVPTGHVMGTETLADRVWTLRIPLAWPSSLYRAAFSSTETGIPDSPDADVHFVVRAPETDTADTADTAASVLVSVPFTTWQAYNRAGVPGEGIYFTEEPTRAARVSFDRPGGGPPPERWEHGLMEWLPRAGYRVDYCANIDLHDDRASLSRYRLLVVNGHDEYWSKEMRDTVERFVVEGGNVAIFAGNTCWWQIRLEDGGRTMVCYRDAVADPVAAVDPSRVTVEWSSAPVNRPENSMIGVSFRRGAGIWGPYMSRMRDESYQVSFADHWAFAGTGLADGDKFAQGALGYETDAADIERVDGVPRITGRDGTPASFVVLATADLEHWRHYGQGGAATMGVFRLGAGTVFNAATVNWGAALGDPVVDQITRNVLDRLSRPPGPGWEAIGPTDGVTALGACEGRLFGVGGDGRLRARDVSGQNLPWRAVDAGPPMRALAAPREAAWGRPLGLYGVTDDARLCYRDPVVTRAPWRDLAAAPAGVRGLASVDNGLFAVTAADELWHLPVRLLAEGPARWSRVGGGAGAIALTAMNGRLYAIGADDRIRTRLPVAGEASWADLCDAGGGHALAGHAGMLVIAADQLRWRPAA